MKLTVSIWDSSVEIFEKLFLAGAPIVGAGPDGFKVESGWRLSRTENPVSLEYTFSWEREEAAPVTLATASLRLPDEDLSEIPEFKPMRIEPPAPDLVAVLDKLIGAAVTQSALPPPAHKPPALLQ